MSTLSDLWKDFFLIFANKGRRKLRDLEKIQDKTFRVQNSLTTSRKNMDEALVTAKTEKGVEGEALKDLQRRLRDTEDNFLIAVDRGDIDDQNILNSEIQTLSQEIVESEATLQFLDNMVTGIENKREMLLLDIAEAERIIRVSAARYRSAETMLRANAGNISSDVFREIEEIKKESVRLQQKNVAITEVADLDQKRTVKAAISRNNKYAALPSAELAQSIRAKRLENKGA